MQVRVVESGYGNAGRVADASVDGLVDGQTRTRLSDGAALPAQLAAQTRGVRS